MKRLLLLSYYFPPHQVPESLLAGRTAQALARAGWGVTTLTNRERVPGGGGDARLLDSVSAVSLKRVGGVEHALVPLKLHRLLAWAGLPELEFLWIRAAVAAGLRLAREQHFDILHSWASPHAGNVAGLLLKRATGLPWVAHFSDPWVDNAYARPNRLQVFWMKRLEKAIVREADAVVFTTPQTVDLVMGKYPESWRRKAVVVPHGYESDLPGASGGAGRFRLVYTGGLYGIRSPDGLLCALTVLRERSFPLADLEVVFVGPMESRHRDMVARSGLDGIVRTTGLLPLREALAEAGRADALLIIDAPSDRPSVFLPSKLVDYLAFAKPILGLTPLQGASADLLRELDCPVIDPRDAEGIADAVAVMHARWKAGGVPVSENFARIARRYHIDATTHALIACLDGCLAERDA